MMIYNEVADLTKFIETLKRSIGFETNVSLIDLKTLSLKRAEAKLDRLLTMADL
jgi:hypothetical protein